MANPAIKTTGLTHTRYDSDIISLPLADAANAARLLAHDPTDPTKFNLAGATDLVVAVSLEPGDPASLNQILPSSIAAKMLTGGGYFEVATDEASVAKGDYLWQAADGQVAKTPTGGLLMQAESAIGAAGQLLVRTVDPVRISRHVVTTADAIANSATITTGWGATADVLSTSINDNAIVAGLAVSAGAAAGDVDVAATNLNQGDIITITTTPNAAN